MTAPAPAWEHHPIMACVDCLMFVANDDVPQDPTEWSADDIEETWPSSDGWHLCAGDSDQDDPFSWQPCECCGSDLGGSRHQLIAMRSLPTKESAV